MYRKRLARLADADGMAEAAAVFGVGGSGIMRMEGVNLDPLACDHLLDDPGLGLGLKAESHHGAVEQVCHNSDHSLISQGGQQLK